MHILKCLKNITIDVKILKLSKKNVEVLTWIKVRIYWRRYERLSLI